MTSDTYLPRLGGGEYHVYYVARELRAMGHMVELVVTEPELASVDTQQPVRRLRYGGLRSLPSMFLALWKLARTADVVHSHYSYRLACVAGVVARLRGRPFIITQHGLGLLPQAHAPLWQDLVFRVWRRISMLCATRIISTSDDLSVEIRALGFGSKITHIPNGYDASLFRPQMPVTQPVLLTVRRLVPKTGIQYLVAALPFVLDEVPDARYLCIGDGRLRQEIVSLARTLHVEHAITFRGPVDHSALLDAYKQAQVVVLPSTAESTSLTCIEAMALGKVVVASRVGGLIELIGAEEERGYLVRLVDSEHSNYEAPFTLPEDRIRRLASAIIHVLRHPAEARTKADAAAAYTPERFDWRVIARRTVDEAYAVVS